jgi:hypothetical protein
MVVLFPGPEKADELTLLDVETDSLHGTESGVGLGEIFNLDHKTEMGAVKKVNAMLEKIGLPQVSSLSQPAACFLSQF